VACLEADFVPSLTTCTYLGVVYTRMTPPLSPLLLLLLLPSLSYQLGNFVNKGLSADIGTRSTVRRLADNVLNFLPCFKSKLL